MIYRPAKHIAKELRKGKLYRQSKAVHVSDDKHSEIFQRMRADPSHAHESDEQLHHRAAYYLVWKDHGRRKPRWTKRILFAVILLLVIFLAIRAHSQVDGIQLQQSGVSKGSVMGGIAKLNFSGCTVSQKSANSWTVTCSGGPGGGPSTDAGTANNFFNSYNADTLTFGKARPSCATLSDSGTLCSSSATIPAAQIQSDWNQVTNTLADYIKNKPTLGSLAAKSSVDYSTTDVTNKPTLGSLAAKSSVDYSTIDITNKPTLGTAAAKDIPASGDATATQVVYGTDTRLSNARTPTAHTHAPSDVTGTAVITTDSRLSDARTPTAHNQAETTITFTDVTTGNASTSNHGYFPKLPTPAGKYLKDDMTWATIAGGGNVSNSGSPAAGQLAAWVTDSTHITGYSGLTYDSVGGVLTVGTAPTYNFTFGAATQTANHGWTAPNSSGPGVLTADASGNITYTTPAPVGATYITQTADGTLSAEQALSSLSTGLLKNTNGTGVLTIGAAGTDYQAPIGTIAGIAKGNGANALTAAVAGTDYQAPIGTISGVVKGNGANALTAAVAGTDYAAANASTSVNGTSCALGGTCAPLPAVVASPAAITIGSGTSINATQLCSTASCPAGDYDVHVYVEVTTACTTTGGYKVWLGYTDDQGAKAGSNTTTYFCGGGLGVTPCTSAAAASLALASTANFMTGDYYLHTTGAATGGLGSINYGTTATACGSGGPMVGKMYFTVLRTR